MLSITGNFSLKMQNLISASAMLDALYRLYTNTPYAYLNINLSHNKNYHVPTCTKWSNSRCAVFAKRFRKRYYCPGRTRWSDRGDSERFGSSTFPVSLRSPCRDFCPVWKILLTNLTKTSLFQKRTSHVDGYRKEKSPKIYVTGYRNLHHVHIKWQSAAAATR